MRVSLLLMLLIAAPALAGRASAPDETDQREANRLSVEIHHLAGRNAWTGVERAFEDIQALGVEPRRGIYLLAASAARHRGDVAAVRERLAHAQAMDDTPDVRAWLDELDADYGHLELRARAGAASLTPLTGNFDPDRRAAVDLATANLVDTGRFSGLLPAGHYTVGVVEFDVTPDASLHVDLRHRQPAITRVAATANERVLR